MTVGELANGATGAQASVESLERVILHVEPYGPHALVVRAAAENDRSDRCRVGAWMSRLQENPPLGLIEATPGFSTLMLEFESRIRPSPEVVRSLLEKASSNGEPDGIAAAPVEVEVVYDGPDLGDVSVHSGLSVGEVVELHASVTYTVRILGFAPGFGYLDGLDPRLQVPRRLTPRPRVPAGSVAIGGEHTGVYPVATAGGWNLIGRTRSRLVDLEKARQGRADAFVMRPGVEVRFVPVAAPI